MPPLDLTSIAFLAIAVFIATALYAPEWMI